MREFIIKSIIFVVLATIALSGRAIGQNDRLNIGFTENGKATTINLLKVEILPHSEVEVPFCLETTNNIVLVNPKLKSLETFDVRLSFDQYRLLLPNLKALHFDNEWVIDVRNRLPYTKGNSKEMKRLGCDVLRVFRVDFNPKNIEGFWWLITGCDQSSNAN